MEPGLSPAAPLNLMTDPGTELFPAVIPERSAVPDDAKAPAWDEAKAPAEFCWKPAALLSRQHTCSELQNCS